MRAHRGLVLVLLSVLLPLAALRCLPLGSIDALSYESGHAWTGSYRYEILRTDDGFQAVCSYEPGMMFQDTESPWSVSVPLTGAQQAQISDIVLRRLRLPLWPDFLMSPIYATDMDGWSLSFSWDGRTYEKGGYDCSPPGLEHIAAFFRALPFPDPPEE